MPNILFFASSPGVGLTYNLTEVSIELNKIGNNIIVISSEKEQMDGLSKLLEKNNIKHYIIPYLDSNSLINLINSINIIKNIIKSEKIDIIHTNAVTHFIKSYIASKTQRRKSSFSLSIHSMLPFYMKNILFLKILTMAVDIFIPVCDSTTQYLLDMGVPEKKVITVNNGINIEHFNNYNNKSRNEKSETVIAYIAGLYPWKGHYYYIKAAEIVIDKYPKTKFLIIGDGPLRAELERKVQEMKLNNNILFLGKIQSIEIPELLKEVDIGVSSSLTEQFPYSIIELMAASKPVVATNVGCIYKMIIDDETGYLIPSKDYISLANAIIKLLNNPKSWDYMGVNAQKLIEKNFTLEIMVNNLEKVYKKLIITD